MRIPPKYIIYTNATDAEKPCQNYRSKQKTDPVGAIMLKAKQAYQYDTRNWNFDICKKYQTVRWKHEDNVMSSRVKEKNRLAEFNYK